MKKVLLGTSAIALAAAFASPAASAEWNVRVGGYMTQAVGYGNSDANFSGDWDGVDVLSNSEIHFLPSITLDNGIKFGANVQLEANTSGDTIDESYMFIKGSFGEILLGSENSAGYKMSYAAPNAGIISINSGSFSSWIPFGGHGELFRGTLGTTALEVSGNNDSQRITYFTPRFAGFQAGASYARDAQQDSSGPTNSDTGLSDIFDLGANYVNSFGDFDLAVSGRYGNADDNSGSNSSIWSVGANIGFAGFTLGGAYAEQNGASHTRQNGESWDVGVSYETGPWGFSAEYFNGTNQMAFGSPGDDEDLDQYLLSASYKLAKGVKVAAFGAYVDLDEDRGNSGEVDGFVIGTGVNLSF